MKRQLLSLVAVVLMTGTASAASLRGGGAAATCGCICPDDACLALYECSQAEHDAEMLRCNLPGGIPLEPGPVIPSGGKGARQLYTTFAADAVVASQPLAASQCKASPADITFCTDAFVAAGCPTNGVKAKAAGWPSAAVTARCGAVLDKTDSCHLFARTMTRCVGLGPLAAQSSLAGGDAHGCIPSAGYEWCDSLQKCYRSFEEQCPIMQTNGKARQLFTEFEFEAAAALQKDEQGATCGCICPTDKCLGLYQCSPVERAAQLAARCPAHKADRRMWSTIGRDFGNLGKGIAGVLNKAACPVMKAAAKIVVPGAAMVTSEAVCVADDVEVAGACELAGGGPEDPFADTCAGVLATAVEVACEAALHGGFELTADGVIKKLGC